MRIQNKVAIVTGAGGDIGREIALRLAEEGARIVASDVTEAGLAATVAAVKAAGFEAIALKADVTQAASVADLMAGAIKHYGRIDILVNCHGIAIPGALTEASDEDFDQTIAINLKGVYLTCKAAVQEMLKSGGGAIVNLSSISGLRGTGPMTAYNASKGGVNLLTYNIASGYKDKGIRCNAICPVNVETRMADKVTDYYAKQYGMPAEAMQEMMLQNHPLKRYVKPREIAHAVLFLASDEALCINGVALNIDQGMGPYVM
ncbi:SDR family NAD(P)-dependent oxidoreductase [Denitratisoma oestradiolicum]|uniref:Uncharacterized protein n=1 Tax=Denitratisoma oestradiolicum TaxID=311182 RepID=A0A6S6XPL2_9PROT|nr:SDR family oxidoreductase [Denitratisoma oestradiolicum]TWO81222.1 hypothetical protein CBW56_06385 [Denitratisoma oestradiolicum]CAB1367921.1 conserved protein of unknown function [Denitratisoma oestradiolicum]